MRRPDRTVPFATRHGSVANGVFGSAAADLQATPLDLLPGKANYFLGNDPDAWVTDVPRYASVQYGDAYPGIDVVYRGSDQRQLEYDFVIQPGADPNSIALDFQGIDSQEIAADGRLLLQTAGGQVAQHAPLIYQPTGKRSPGW